jgi:hypothetical protein
MDECQHAEYIFGAHFYRHDGKISRSAAPFHAAGASLNWPLKSCLSVPELHSPYLSLLLKLREIA